MTPVGGSGQAAGPARGWCYVRGAEAGRAAAEPPVSPQAELPRQVGENETLRQELQMVETERVRLSLLEEKLEDVLGLLQRLRDLVGSRRLHTQAWGGAAGLGPPASGTGSQLSPRGQVSPPLPGIGRAQGKSSKRRGGSLTHFMKLI